MPVAPCRRVLGAHLAALCLLSSAGVAQIFCNPPAPRVIINEINYNSDDDPIMPPPWRDSEDWIEIINIDDAPVDLFGWSIADDDNGLPFQIPAGVTLAPRELLVIVDSGSKFSRVHPGVPFLGDSMVGQSAAGDVVWLRAPGNCVADEVRYSDGSHPVPPAQIDPWPTGPDGTGATLSLGHPLLDNDLPESWEVSPDLGTPAADNHGRLFWDGFENASTGWWARAIGE